MAESYVLGLDWINREQEWACCRLSLNAPVASPRFLTLDSRAEEHEALVRNAAKIVLDAPIGLPPDQSLGCALRSCDRAAKFWIGSGLQSSVFPVPFEGELAEWRRRHIAGNEQLKGHIRGLLPAIDSAERIAASNKGTLESHPELVFAALTGRQLPSAAQKKTLLGTLVRAGVLAAHGVGISLRELAVFPRIQSDNFIDAAAMAIVARHWHVDGKVCVLRTNEFPEHLDSQRKQVMGLPPLTQNGTPPSVPFTIEELLRLAAQWKC